MGHMTMREECKHFQSRTYQSGEVARFCVLDLAPEAPWRCPDDCAAYERRLADVAWNHGSLVPPAVEAEPEEVGEDVMAALDYAEEVISNAVPEALEEVRRQEARAARPWWRRRG